MTDQVTIPRALLEQTLSAIDWAADQIAPQAENCACPLCVVGVEWEKVLVRHPDPRVVQLNAWAADRLARHGIPEPGEDDGNPSF